ncbi:hypothetical protein I5Q34_17445 [Streptomyces sp. AV19]|uniref:hypothetical protein n=1 Tax=Streptomyces sp. AV19 TaxID=2793068 RepID=UPI0018FEE70A|nr:hypothetical protein [Streptomyces sp. AV19]MBH1936032.1 hypothetical protein [Streptomyces sp. AV19]MDG4534176.1 hypothetical protein [Streptomyces sp. AV19]
MAEHEPYAAPEWIKPGTWYGTAKITIRNPGTTALVNPEISFRVRPDQYVENRHGLVFIREGDVITGYFVFERSTVPPDGGSQEFTVNISRAVPGPGPLPSGFRINGRPAPEGR